MREFTHRIFSKWSSNWLSHKIHAGNFVRTTRDNHVNISMCSEAVIEFYSILMFSKLYHLFKFNENRYINLFKKIQWVIYAMIAVWICVGSNYLFVRRWMWICFPNEIRLESRIISNQPSAGICSAHTILIET